MFDKYQDNNSSNQGNLLRGQLTPKLVGAMVIINRTAGVLSTPSFVFQGFRLQAMAIPL